MDEMRVYCTHLSFISFLSFKMRALCILVYAILQLSEGSCFVSRYSRSSAQTALSATYSNTDSKAEYANQIVECNDILYRAASTRNEDPELVLSALEKLEKLYREKRKTEGETVAKQVLSNLNGRWRLVFTTGTKSTQDRFQTKINYVPFKAIQSFNSTQQPFVIENGIYAWDFPVIKFSGGFDFDLRKSKLEFDFNQVSFFGATIQLKPMEAAKIGAGSGLGSESNVKNVQEGRKAFFNWISADDNIATARGGGGGLALWKRIDTEKN